MSMDLRKAFFVAAAIGICPASVTAGQHEYHCEALQVHSISDVGMLEPLPALLTNLPDHRRFAVSRITGQFVGGPMSLFRDWETTVLATGNDRNSFKVLWYTSAADAGMHAVLLTVEEYASGPRKPFLLADNAMAYSGLCD